MSRVTVLLFPPSKVTADVVFSAASLAAVIEIWRRLMTGIFDPYRPELHYMRGPGPKWREKHACNISDHGMNDHLIAMSASDQAAVTLGFPSLAQMAPGSSRKPAGFLPRRLRSGRRHLGRWHPATGPSCADSFIVGLAVSASGPRSSVHSPLSTDPSELAAEHSAR